MVDKITMEFHYALSSVSESASGPNITYTAIKNTVVSKFGTPGTNKEPWFLTRDNYMIREHKADKQSHKLLSPEFRPRWVNLYLKKIFPKSSFYQHPHVALLTFSTGLQGHNSGWAHSLRLDS